ncbi:MAG: hypothetical protein HQK54_13945, partial [Oligoflexales bacterium]|nr:hypothetical protein [Oligoflexales bacterium]
TNHSLAKQIIISDKLDQEYNHTILIRDNGPISVDEMNGILDKMEKGGQLKSLWWRYGIGVAETGK